MRISVVGLGWYGLPLAQTLEKAGHQVQGSSRSPEKIQDIKAFKLSPPSPLPMELAECDIMILNIPPFDGALEWFQSWHWKTRPWMIFISSTGSNPLLASQEKWVQENFASWTILRFGGLHGSDRHPGKHLSGKQNLKGRLWPVNLLHLEDAIAFTQVVIKRQLKQETFVVVGDHHPTREEYYTEYCRQHGLDLPHFDPSDYSQKEAISNEKASRYYNFRF